MFKTDLPGDGFEIAVLGCRSLMLVIIIISPYLKILTDYLLENFGDLCTVSIVWLEKVSPCRFAFPNIFLKDNYYIFAYASCGSAEHKYANKEGLHRDRNVLEQIGILLKVPIDKYIKGGGKAL